MTDVRTALATVLARQADNLIDAIEADILFDIIREGDEVAHMDRHIFEDVVVPVLHTGSAFIGITTLAEDEGTNFVSRIVGNATDSEGEYIFKIIDMKIQCKRCSKSYPPPPTCRHVMGEIPYWHDHEGIKLRMELRERFRKFVISVLGSDPHNRTITLTNAKR